MSPETNTSDKGQAGQTMRGHLRRQKLPELKVVGQEQENIEPKQLELKNISWARLLATVFNIDVEPCIKCSGKMRIIAIIEDP